MSDQPTGITAECPVCGVSFFKAPGERLEPEEILSCETCGLKLSYAFLQSRTPPRQEEPHVEDSKPAKPRVRKRKAGKAKKGSAA